MRRFALTLLWLAAFSACATVTRDETASARPRLAHQAQPPRRDARMERLAARKMAAGLGNWTWVREGHGGSACGVVLNGRPAADGYWVDAYDYAAAEDACAKESARESRPLSRQKGVTSARAPEAQRGPEVVGPPEHYYVPAGPVYYYYGSCGVIYPAYSSPYGEYRARVRWRYREAQVVGQYVRREQTLLNTPPVLPPRLFPQRGAPIRVIPGGVAPFPPPPVQSLP